MRRSTPTRGLLAGLLALVAFASLAVAMTTGRPSTGTPTTPQGQTLPSVASADGRIRGRGGRDLADAGSELSGDLGEHHR
jgi:hypothetical protein